MWNYRIYGLTLESNFPFRSLPSIHPAGEPDLRLIVDRGRDHPMSQLPSDRWLQVSRSGDDRVYQCCEKQTHRGQIFWRHRFVENRSFARFLLSPEGDRIFLDFNRPLNVDNLNSLLLSPVLPSVLHLQGLFCLHAASVSTEPGAILLAGLTGSGKSTLGAAFAKEGFPILSDDLAAVTREQSSILAHPGAPRMRLWPESARRFVGDIGGLRPVLSNLDKVYVELGGEKPSGPFRFESGPRPLAAIVVIGKRGPFRLQQVQGRRRFSELLPHVRSTPLQADPASRKREFLWLTGLAEQVPCWNLQVPDDLNGLEGVCNRILRGIDLPRASLEKAPTGVRA